MTICQWAEKRAQRFDGLAYALTAFNQEHEYLCAWLERQEEALALFRSAHHLDTSADVLEQVHHLQAMESDLEAEHGRFVSLSQLASEIAARIDTENGAAANGIRLKLENVTQRWDNLVTRIDEHSQMVSYHRYRCSLLARLDRPTPPCMISMINSCGMHI
jgi:hypothetical protein